MAPVGRHAVGPAIVDPLEDPPTRPAEGPAAMRQVGPHPPSALCPMAAVAVHRCEDLSALLRRLLVTVVGVPARDRGQGGRGGAAREDVLVLAHASWRAGRIRSGAR